MMDFEIINEEDCFEIDIEKQKIISTIYNLLYLEDSNDIGRVDIDIHYRTLVIQCQRSVPIYKKVIKILINLAIEFPLKVVSIGFITVNLINMINGS